jgi:uncharacterized cupin superfamily protein
MGMKAVRLTALGNGKCGLSLLPLPVFHRKGNVPAKFFHDQALGLAPLAEQSLGVARSLRSIILKNGRVPCIASEPGALLTCVVSGELLLDLHGAQTRLQSGDIFLLDRDSPSCIRVTAKDDCRLVQIAVTEEWPGADAEIQEPGDANPRDGSRAKLKRMDRRDDYRTYLSELEGLFPAARDEWSAARSVLGFRFMCWEEGFIDWHPEVVNNLAIILSGEVEVQTSGDQAVDVFRAGDICLATDEVGEGHTTRSRGVTHLCIAVFATADLW